MAQGKPIGKSQTMTKKAEMIRRAMLETIAKLIEGKATTAAEAAEIVRDCKLKA